jgi:hypothetical protein
LELALELLEPAEAIEAKIRSKQNQESSKSTGERVDEALASGRITAEEAELWWSYERLRIACIMVDDFPREAGKRAGAMSMADDQRRPESAEGASAR